MARYQYKYRRPQRRHFGFGKLLITLTMVFLMIYPFYEASELEIDEHDVFVSNLPSSLKNIRIVYFSDVHQCAWFSQRRVDKLIQTVNGLSADLILLGGDYAEDSDGAVAFFHTAPLMHARVGVYGIVGNHDRTIPESNLNELMTAMKVYGCIPLVNAVEKVKIGRDYLYIAGVDDYNNGFPDVDGVASRVRQEDFVIFLGHTPELLPDALKAKGSDNDNHWFDLALFGHTHGGQINLLGWTPFSDFKSKMDKRYLHGWLEENRASLLISNGVGTSGVPMRLFAKPQLHVITLKSK